MRTAIIKHILLICTLLALTLTGYSQSAVSHDSGNMIISAVSEYTGGNYAKASEILTRIVSGDSSNDAAWYYLAMCSIAQKDTEGAEKYLLKAVEADPGNFWYRYRLAGLYAMTSRPELTVDMYEKLLVDFPKKSDLYFDLVELYLSTGEDQKALDTISEIETVFGTTETLAVYKFNLLMKMQRQEEAYKSVEQYNSRYSSPYILTILAEHQLSMYNDSTALAYFNEALEIASDYSPALLGKAETYRMTRRYDDYFRVLNDYVANPSDRAEAKAGYLTAAIRHFDARFLQTFRSQMDEVVERVVKVHPSDSSALHIAGLYYYTTGRDELAQKKFRENMLANPDNMPVAVNYVEFLMYAQKWEELSAQGYAAYDRFPQETAFIEMASIGEYNLGNYDKVLEICDIVLDKAPADSSRTLRAWSTKGDIYHKLGQRKKSYRSYERALKINPDYNYVLNNYAYFLSMGGKNLKKALAMSRKTIEAEPDNATYLDTYGWILYLLGRAEEAKPHFKHAMLYGGKDSAVILDHYAEVLFALGEYERAMVYWNSALRRNDGDIPDLEERIALRKSQMKKKTDRR